MKDDICYENVIKRLKILKKENIFVTFLVKK